MCLQRKEVDQSGACPEANTLNPAPFPPPLRRAVAATSLGSQLHDQSSVAAAERQYLFGEFQALLGGLILGGGR